MIKKRNIVFLGPPGVGKGTIARMISEKDGILHISVGEIFRTEIKNKTAIGRRVEKYVNSGNLVPDDLVAEMVGARLTQADCDNGYILDGFPRTLPQAEIFEEVLKKNGKNLDIVVYFHADEELLLKRLTARIICKECGTNYNKIFTPPQKEGICDKCGGELYQRADDSLETAKERLALYHKETAPLVDYYKKQGCMVSIDGGTHKDVAFTATREVLS